MNGSAAAAVAAPRRAGTSVEVAPRPVATATIVFVLGATAIAYLSVPDTEGPLLVLTILVPLAVAAAANRLAITPAVLAGGAITALVLLALVTWRGAAGRVSVSGWWIAKLGLAAAMVAAAVIGARGLRPNGRVRRSP